MYIIIIIIMSSGEYYKYEQIRVDQKVIVSSESLAQMYLPIIFFYSRYF